MLVANPLQIRYCYERSSFVISDLLLFVISVISKGCCKFKMDMSNFMLSKMGDTRSIRGSCFHRFLFTFSIDDSLYEGDMILDGDQKNAIFNTANRYASIKDTRKLWPRKIIPYMISADICK